MRVPEREKIFEFQKRFQSLDFGHPRGRIVAAAVWERVVFSSLTEEIRSKKTERIAVKLTPARPLLGAKTAGPWSVFVLFYNNTQSRFRGGGGGDSRTAGVVF